MNAIVIAMLGVQVVMALAMAFVIAWRKPTSDRPRPIWTVLTLALVAGAGLSWTVVEVNAASSGLELLRFGAAVLFGMALITQMMAVRQQRGLDAEG